MDSDAAESLSRRLEELAKTLSDRERKSLLVLLERARRRTSPAPSPGGEELLTPEERAFLDALEREHPV